MPHQEFRERVDAIAKYVNAPYTQFLERLGLAIDFVRAEGARVYDREGRCYIDCIAGYGNLNVGHNHPRVLASVIEELHSSRPYNLPFLSESQARLAEKLAEVMPGDLECTLFVNSGSEAVDSALKLARLATGKSHVVAMRGAWHGFTVGAMSVSEPAMCRGFLPLLSEVTHVPYGDAGAVSEAITSATGAVIVEPLQAESGAIVPPPGYLNELAEICTRKNVVLIFDEVKSGIGKTGRLFACEHDAAVPDVLLAGKALGGGAVPIGTVSARRKLWGKVGLSFPMSSTSGGGNAPACAAALTVLEIVRDEKLCEQAERKGRRLRSAIAELAREHPAVITDVSGRGLLIGIRTPSLRMASDLISGCLKRGVLMMAAFCNRTHVLIEPPLGIEDECVEDIIAALRATALALDSSP